VLLNEQLLLNMWFVFSCIGTFILVPLDLIFRHGIINYFVVSLNGTGKVRASLFFFFKCSKFCDSFWQDLSPFREVHSRWLILLIMYVYQMLWNFYNLFKSCGAFHSSFNICINSWRNMFRILLVVKTISQGFTFLKVKFGESFKRPKWATHCRPHP